MRELFSHSLLQVVSRTFKFNVKYKQPTLLLFDVVKKRSEARSCWTVPMPRLVSQQMVSKGTDALTVNQTKAKKMEKEKRHYEPPRVEVIKLESQGVLCGSSINGNSTESVGSRDFGWI